MEKQYNIITLLNNEYLDVYEKMYLEDRCEFLFAVWRDLILPNSDKKIFQIGDKAFIIIEMLNEFKINGDMGTSIGSLDKKVVSVLLKIAIKLKKVTIVDFVFKRTKSAAKAMPQYFYPEIIIDSYIALLEIDKAKDALIYISNIEHRSYWYRIMDINIDKYIDYPDFVKLLKDLKYKSIASLLKEGEEINLKLNLNSLKAINQYI